MKTIVMSDACALQAIAFNQLQEDQHETLLHESIQLARKVADEFENTNVSITELAIEISVG